MIFAFDNSYARLPERFYARLDPEPVECPALVKLNEPLAEELGLSVEALRSPAGVAMLAGNAVPEGANPLAMAYAGHQFGAFVPQLGDGRALLLGEIVAPSGTRLDVQLKGSGRTPFSRMGDGRAWLGPVLREYLISEAMHALGIPTTRALAAVTTGQPVYRETARPGAILTRVARSHVRIGTFQYFLAQDDEDAIKHLADYVMARHYPEAAGADRPYRALLEAVVACQAELVAKWLGIGFIHGVMNTDNTSIAGETIDFGPCAFMDEYHPGTVYSSIDQGGRYAYANQPRIAQWNLARLAQALLPLLAAEEAEAVEQAQAVIDSFGSRFERAYFDTFRRKLGLAEVQDGDAELINALLKLMVETQADFTNTFRALCDAASGREEAARAEIGDDAGYAAWSRRWRARLERGAGDAQRRIATMKRANPVLIPRNHRVEAALDAAVTGDLAPFEDLLNAVTDPWRERPEADHYRQPPAPHEIVRQTFCGT